MKNHIHESNLIEGINSIRADADSLEAWQFLQQETRLTPAIICHVQRLITAHQTDLADRHRGQWRDCGVTVGGRSCPHPNRISDLMTDWLKSYQNSDVVEAHIHFEHIHPLVDGNGRTGRMLLWWDETQRGLEPTLFYAREKFENYYPIFDKGNL